MKTFVLGRAPRRPLTRSLRSEAGDSTNRNSLCPTKLGQDRANCRHPTRREVPLGTRRLEFAQTSPRAATRSL